MRRKIHAAIVIGIVSLSLGISPDSGVGQDKPNIILINLDDADCEMFELPFSDVLYPNIMGVANSGINFTNLHVTTPLCGPSRACLYRAQYAHNTGICVNEARVPSAHGYDAGFKYYREQGYFNDDLSIWMKNAGYRTMIVGKFLHHDFEPFVPPGWDDFYTYLGGKYYDTFQFTNEFSPAGTMQQLPPNIYRTDAEAIDAVRLIEKHVARGENQPFFLNINPFGPHSAGSLDDQMINNKMKSWWPEAVQPYSPAFCELDISDKRGFFKSLSPTNFLGYYYNHVRYRDRALATRSVDEMVGEIEATLARLELDENTYVFITSDNGYLLGHHRVEGKGLPTDRATRVPLFVKGPNVPQGSVSNHLIAHIDLAPTFVSLANGTIPDFVDGRSFSNLLTQSGLDGAGSFRDAILIENWLTFGVLDKECDAASTALRLKNSVYTEWANGDKDFYDLSTDPHQLDNSFDQLSPSMKEYYAGRLRLLKNPSQGPAVRFSHPFKSGQIIPLGSDLRGIAEDSVGIHHVRLAILDVGSRRWWNGTDWQDDVVQVESELENPNGQITFWNYRSVPTQSDEADSSLTVWAWAYNSNDFSLPSSMEFSFEED